MYTGLYLVPGEQSANPQQPGHGPKYFYWNPDLDPDPPGIRPEVFEYKDYGFFDAFLVMALNITDAEHASLLSQPDDDVYAFPYIMPGPESGKVRFVGVDWLQVSKLDRNGVDQSVALAAIVPGDDENPTYVTVDADGNSDSATFEVFGALDMESTGVPLTKRGPFYQYRIWKTASQGDLADGENITLNSTLQYVFDDKQSSMENLDIAIPGGDPIRDAFEGLNIPTDWLTASNTYRELLRQTMGMLSINQRYAFYSGGNDIFGSGRTLDSRYRDMSAQEQAWFAQTIASFGYDPSLINENNTFRQMLKAASDVLAARAFTMGGFEF